jgi:hypothetical protein
MRLKPLLVCSILLFSFEEADTWEPCMPFCDTLCTAPAAVKLSISTVTKYTEMGLELAANSTKIMDLTTKSSEYFSVISTQEQLASQSYITALDGVEKKISTQIEMLGMANVAKTDYLATQVLQVKKEIRVVDRLLINNKKGQIKSLAFANNALLMSTEFIKNHDESENLRKKAYHTQRMIPSNLGTNNIIAQRTAMMNEVNLNSENPFIAIKLDKELWEEYQKYVALIYNFTPQDAITSLSSKRTQLKRLVALNALSGFMSENVSIPEVDSKSLSQYLGTKSLTVKNVLFNSYQKHLLDVNTQLQTKVSNELSLLVIHNIQLAQRNMMLNELRKIKQSKNVLSSLLVI